MEINGREVKFKRTVSATCKIAEMCKDGDIKNAGTLFDGNYQTSQKSAAKFMAVMSEGYEQNRKFREAGYEPRPLSEEEALNLEEDEFSELFAEAVKAYSGEKPTIETEPVKSKKKAEIKSN